MMTQESFRRILIGVFWCSLMFTLGFSWIYIRYAVPDKLNLVVNEEEVFHFSLPPGITFESDSEEVILKNSSDIPDGMIRIDRPDSVSMCGKNEGSYLVGMKFLGLILMKEIQAALDDSNVDRYAKYLHKLTKHTQFIVITHRRGTMLAADRLYGITMQEKGVSTLVSVNLIENDLK